MIAAPASPAPAANAMRSHLADEVEEAKLSLDILSINKHIYSLNKINITIYYYVCTLAVYEINTAFNKDCVHLEEESILEA